MISSQQVDEYSSYFTKWYLIAPLAYLLFKVIDLIRLWRVLRQLGAKPLVNNLNDGSFGIKAGRQILKLKATGELLDFNIERFKNLENTDIDTFSLRVFGAPIIITKDPENIKAMLATQFNDFSLGFRHGHFKPLLGDGIFTLDGEGWKHSRAMLRPQFAREQVAHVKALEPHMQTLAKHVRKYNGAKFDIQELFFRLTVDSATEFLFGESVVSLEDASIGMEKNAVSFDGKDGFADAFNYSQEILATRAVFQKFSWIINPKKFRDCNAKVHQFADYYVGQALKATPEEIEKKSSEGYTFLYELVKHTRDPKILRDQLLNILVAGRDTTAGLLSFAFYELARNPEVWRKLKEEIYEKFGSGDDARIDEITFESLKKCEYLKAVINETLRLYPSVPQNFRVATKDTTLPRGGGPDGHSPVFIPKGQNVIYQVYVTHRDQKVYGKDAEQYRPERWFEPSTRKLGWAFVPFNGGPRICLGQQFALTEASYVITRLAQMFPNLDCYHDEPNFKKQSHLTMSIKDGCPIGLY
ncbi:CYP52A13 protein [Suhomyces tanzawaensis NRRL Y-17324]|uniref:CYP52A13 protein n=1 Tax=Suhomyces tanzawaensis NRRL Y-17324 TaxID=984487 RepID=A0A1E4SCG7_9ASCO|nr:CYP52A13 protein [Suhomyces tanzawaensis NRRL Y-17324]ODV77204.1 CYP52A13 protein [Suhomyces tanzawaensis NRRL Y-17324]